MKTAEDSEDAEFFLLPQVNTDHQRGYPHERLKPSAYSASFVLWFGLDS